MQNASSKILSCLLVFLPLKALATDYGKLGKVYDIAEPDLIDAMQKKMSDMQSSGELQKRMDKFIADSKNFVKRPKGVKLPYATTYLATAIDVTYVLPEDISDQNGKILFKKGKTINPLEIYPLRTGFCFIDGDSAKQVKWAKESCYPQQKIVLVNGNYADISQRLNTRLYFDQQAKLVKTFGIVQLPTVIRQSGNQLIKEVFPVD